MRIFNIKVNGQPYEVEVEEISSSNIIINPQPVSNPVPAPAPVQAPPVQKAQVAVSVNGTALKAPMPGTILDFKVNSGDNVKKGQAVLILEAMKMENEIAASADGVINFSVSKGASVNTGDVLATIQ